MGNSRHANQSPGTRGNETGKIIGIRIGNGESVKT